MNTIPSSHRRKFLVRMVLLGAAGTLAKSLPAWAFSPTRSTVTRQKKEIMLQELTLNDFSPHLGSKFKLRLDSDRHLEMKLAEATPLNMGGARPAHLTQRGAFSIVFLAPAESQLTQQIYRLEHDVMGELEIFLVPIGRTPNGLKCEAIFN